MPLNSKHCMRAHARHSLLLVMLSQLLHSKLCVLRVHLYTGPKCPSHLPHGTYRNDPAGRAQGSVAAHGLAAVTVRAQ